MRFDIGGYPEAGALRSRRRSCAAILCLLAAAFLFASAVLQAGEVRRFEVTIAGRAVTVGGPTIRVTEGDQVIITWHSDEAGELHLHGYDKSIDLKAGEVTETVIDALVAGRFPVTSHGFAGEDHGHGQGALLYLEVYPE